jgi:hypothetical protein
VRVKASGGAGKPSFVATWVLVSASIGALMAQRADGPVPTWLREDVFCYELPADDFFTLTQKSTVFNLFCTQYIAGLLKQSQQQLQLHLPSARRAEDDEFAARRDCQAGTGRGGAGHVRFARSSS